MVGGNDQLHLFPSFKAEQLILMKFHIDVEFVPVKHRKKLIIGQLDMPDRIADHGNGQTGSTPRPIYGKRFRLTRD